MQNPSPKWKLSAPVAADTQALVVSGFGRLETGRSLFAALPSEAGGAWLKALNDKIPVTDAARTGRGKVLDRAAAIAFTASGLERIGLSEATLASFAPAFREGMFQEDRLRRLGDRRKDKWMDTVIKGGPRWSGNVAAPETINAPEAYSVGPEKVSSHITTDLTVHALILLYAHTEADADALVEVARAALEPLDVKIVHQLPLLLDVESSGISREHFGFADGLSQPLPFDAGGAVERGGETVTQPDPVHGVPLGEFLMGYSNGHQEHPPGPVVPGEPDTPDGGRPERAGLRPHAEARGFYDFGRNGSYLVVRELHQDVAAFWKAMNKASEIIRSKDPDATHITAGWIAARVVGRDKEGHLLRPGGPAPAGRNDLPDNDFLFFDKDRHGFGCPLGSHVRRANPRDSLAPEESMKETLLSAANNHRILRRARKYGSNLADPGTDDGADRGLLFMCLNTDIARQFEFVQQTWLLNSDFHTLFEEVDPLVGPDGWMTLPEDPLRRRIEVQTFVQMAGGEYFFLPGMAALRYLSLL